MSSSRSSSWAGRRRRDPGVRDRGQPAGQPNRAVRVQSDGRAAGQGRGPGDGGRLPRRTARRRGCCAPPVTGGHVSVKEAVLPFARFPDADTLLGPEMRSTGEVMGIDSSFGLAFAKSQAAAGDELPAAGRCSSRWRIETRRPGWRWPAGSCSWVSGWRPSAADRPGTAGRRALPTEAATGRPVGTAGRGPVRPARRTRPGDGPRCRGGRRRGPAPGRQGRSGGQHAARPGPRADGAYIRRAANQHRVACLTTVAAARAARGRDRRPGRPAPCRCAACRSITSRSSCR